MSDEIFWITFTGYTLGSHSKDRVFEEGACYEAKRVRGSAGRAGEIFAKADNGQWLRLYEGEYHAAEPRSPLDRPTARFAYSLHGERYEGDFASVSDALKEARGMAPRGTSVYVGERTAHALSDLLDVDDFLEQASERAGDTVWPDHEWEPRVCEEARAAFAHMLDEWAHHFDLQPDFFTVEDPTEFGAIDEDL